MPTIADLLSPAGWRCLATGESVTSDLPASALTALGAWVRDGAECVEIGDLAARALGQQRPPVEEALRLRAPRTLVLRPPWDAMAWIVWVADGALHALPIDPGPEVAHCADRASRLTPLNVALASGDWASDLRERRGVAATLSGAYVVAHHVRLVDLPSRAALVRRGKRRGQERLPIRRLRLDAGALSAWTIARAADLRAGTTRASSPPRTPTPTPVCHVAGHLRGVWVRDPGDAEVYGECAGRRGTLYQVLRPVAAHARGDGPLAVRRSRLVTGPDDLRTRETP